MTIQLTRDDLGRALWGGMPLPVAMDYRGTVRSEHGNPVGALLLSGVGIYVLGAGGVVSSLDQREARMLDRPREILDAGRRYTDAPGETTPRTTFLCGCHRDGSNLCYEHRPRT